MQDVLGWSLVTVAEKIQTKQISPVEVTKKMLGYIKLNPKLNAYITLDEEEALVSALQAEQEINSGNIRGLLHGVPIALKDLIYTKGLRTTMGSKIYEDFVPDFNATVVEKLKHAGAIILGKLNMHQFAYGTTGDRSFFGAVKNPYDTAKVTGGSSSGAGAAVANGLCYAALGTDTGGSIRIPASFCGIVGMKPTFGRVSNYGVFPLAWTLDHVGPMTRTVKDNAVLLRVLCGYDEKDMYSFNRKEEDFTRYLEQGIKGSVIGIPDSFYFDNINEEIRLSMEKAIETFRFLGAEIRSVNISELPEISLAHLITLQSEAYAVHQDNLKKYPDAWIDEVKERLLISANRTASEYIYSQQVKWKATQTFNHVFREVDILLTPTVPMLPTNINQREIVINGETHHVFSQLNRFTGPTNLNGLPSMSIPCGFSSDGLPIGMQLIGRAFDEATMYRFAYAFEQERCIPTLNI